MLKLRGVAWLFSVGMLFLGAGVVSGQTTSTGSGQAYPNKPIRIVTSEAGGSTDLTARIIAQGISGPLGQPVIVDNRGTGFITGEIVARAPPDGYSLVVAAGAFWITPLFRKTPYDPINDFAPISMLVNAPIILVVNSSVPATSVKELIALAKGKPGELNYAASGNGGAMYLAAELFKSMAGVNIVGVNYKSGPAAFNDVLGGQVQMIFVSVGTLAPHLKGGKVRALAVTSPGPSALFPGLPTVAASGLPGFESGSLIGLFAPAKTPATVINRLNQEVVRVLNLPDVKEKFLTLGVESVASSPEQLTAKMKSEIARLGKIIKDAGIKAE